jgi:hypothetical protein
MIVPDEDDDVDDAVVQTYYQVLINWACSKHCSVCSAGSMGTRFFYMGKGFAVCFIYLFLVPYIYIRERVRFLLDKVK